MDLGERLRTMFIEPIEDQVEEVSVSLVPEAVEAADPDLSPSLAPPP